MTAPAGTQQDQVPRRLRLVVVGAGTVTVDLLRGLSRIWKATVVDPDPERLARAGKVRSVDAIEGDGSSRVVLELAQYERADALVAASGDDAVNLEACRLAQQAGVVRVLAVANDPDALSGFRDLGVPAWSPDRLAARRVEINLEPGWMSSATFADGKAEAVEFRITEDSPTHGKSLAELHSDRWLVAAILREGQVVVPHGTTRIRAGDLVTAVGAAADHGLIVRSFVSGHSRFPVDYGRQVAVAVDSADDLPRVAEALHITRHTSAQALLVVHRVLDAVDQDRRDRLEALLGQIAAAAGSVEIRFRGVPGSPVRALPAVCREESVGVAVLRLPAGGALARRLGVPDTLRRARKAGVPALFASGRDEYHHVAVALQDLPGSVDAARAAVDLAAMDTAGLTGVAAVPQGPGMARSRRRSSRAAEHLRVEAAAAGIPVRGLERRGSIPAILEEAAEADLIVMPMPAALPSFFQPTAAGQLLRRGGASLLLVPPPG